MEVSTEKGKIKTNSTHNISADINMNGQKLEEVTSFKYLGATLYEDGTCSAEVRIRITSAMAAMSRLTGSGSATPLVLQASSSATSLFVTSCNFWPFMLKSALMLFVLLVMIFVFSVLTSFQYAVALSTSLLVRS